MPHNDDKNKQNSVYNDDQINSENNNDTHMYSKESIIAKLYRKKVFCPFIHNVRVTQYNMDPDADVIPDHLQAAAWMDGASGQVKLITDEENLKKEIKLKITCGKQSAARTAVE